MNKYIGLFLCMVIDAEKYRFSYGRTLTKTYFTSSKIKLPATKEGKPDWQWMEDYIKSLPYSNCI